MAASASAVSITYSTSGVFTLCSGGGQGTPGCIPSFGATAGASLTYALNPNSNSGVPSGINLGDFVLTCPSCGTAASLSGAFFQAFTFRLTITDATDGNATGYFLGSSTGGNVYSDASNIIINWGSLVTTSGNFGSTVFAIYTPTPIVAPNSGCPLGCGDTTVQGTVNSSGNAVPEPATLGLIGGGLLGLGVVLRRKKRA